MKFATILFGAFALVSAASGNPDTPKLRVSVLKKATCDRKSRVGDTIAMHYVGRLEDGSEFDSSLKRGKTFDFALGSGMVIEGWEKGLRGMCPGEERRLTIPPQLGYGMQSVGGIPAGSTLIFDTVLVGINGDKIDYDVEAALEKQEAKTSKLVAKAKAAQEKEEL